MPNTKTKTITKVVPVPIPAPKPIAKAQVAAKPKKKAPTAKARKKAPSVRSNKKASPEKTHANTIERMANDERPMTREFTTKAEVMENPEDTALTEALKKRRPSGKKPRGKKTDESVETIGMVDVRTAEAIAPALEKEAKAQLKAKDAIHDEAEADPYWEPIRTAADTIVAAERRNAPEGEGRKNDL